MTSSDALCRDARQSEIGSEAGLLKSIGTSRFNFVIEIEADTHDARSIFFTVTKNSLFPANLRKKTKVHGVYPQSYDFCADHGTQGLWRGCCPPLWKISFHFTLGELHE